MTTIEYNSNEGAERNGCNADDDKVGGPVVGSKAEIATTTTSKRENYLEGGLQLSNGLS